MNPTPPTAPRVSVIVRTCRRPRLLVRALHDILGQSFQDFELIVVDEADSPDQVSEIVDALPPADRLKVVVVSRAGLEHGRWIAANAGIRRARGEFIVLHDDDDLWDTRFLATVIDWFDRRRDTVAACTRTEIVIERPDAEGRLQRTDSYPFLPELVAITLMDMLRGNRIPPISLMYRRTLHDDFGPYDESLSVLGDWEFYLRLLQHHRIDLIDERLAYWSHRPEDVGGSANSISRKDIRAETEARIRDDLVRSGVSAGGISSFAHTANEMNWLSDRIASAVAAAASDVAAEGAAAERRITDRIGNLEGRLDALHLALIERTSLSRRIRRLFSR